MAAIITDPAAFYRFSASDIWAEINPQLGEAIRLATRVEESLIIFNKFYPPPPPRWQSQLAVVLAVACICCVAGAVILTGAGAGTAATAGVTASTNAAASANAAVATAASASGTTVSASTTLTVGQVAGYAKSAATYVGPIAKAVGSATGNTKAEKIGAVADVISGDTKFTEGVSDVYKITMKEKNLRLKEEGEDALRDLAYNQQNQYADFLRKQAAAERQKELTGRPGQANYAGLLIPAGVAAALIIGG